MRIHVVVWLIVLVGTLPILRSAEDDVAEKVYVITSMSDFWQSQVLRGLSNIYAVPVAIESLDMNWWKRSSYQYYMISLPYSPQDPGESFAQMLAEIKAVTDVDAHTVSLLTDEIQRYGPPHMAFAQSVPVSMLDTGEATMTGMAQAMDDIDNENHILTLVVGRGTTLLIPAIQLERPVMYLDLFRAWSRDLRQDRNRNVSWFLVMSRFIPGRPKRNLYFNPRGFHGPNGAIMDIHAPGARWICSVSGFHPLLGAMALSQALAESQVDFYVFSVPEPKHSGSEDSSPSAPGAVLDPQGGGRATSLKAWSLYASGIANGDVLGELLSISRSRYSAPIERIRHSFGNELRVNQRRDFFGTKYVAGEHQDDQGVEGFLASTLRRHWPDITLHIGPCHPVFDGRRTVPAMNDVHTVRDVLFRLVPPDVKGTWILLEGLSGEYTISFHPFQPVRDLSKQEPFLSDNILREFQRIHIHVPEDDFFRPSRIAGIISMNTEELFEDIKRIVNVTPDDMIKWSATREVADVDKIARYFKVRAIGAIATNPHPDAPGFFLSLRQHENEIVRQEFIKALATMDPEFARPLLQEMMTDDSPAVRDKARRYFDQMSAVE